MRLNPFGLRGIFAKETLTIAAGAVTASLVSNFTVAKFNAILPMANTPFGRAGYNLLLPIAAAMVVNRWVPNLAKGLIIGGLANGIGQLVTATGVIPAAAIPQVPAVSLLAPAPVGEYLGEYLGGDAFDNAVGAAFATNAWA